MQQVPITIKVQRTQGSGKGMQMGIPTINFAIPHTLELPFGVYAGWLISDTKKYGAAIHFGPRPTLNEHKPSLEAYILDGVIKNVPDILELILIKSVRGAETFHFNSEKEMLLRIDQDIKEVKTILSSNNR